MAASSGGSLDFRSNRIVFYGLACAFLFRLLFTAIVVGWDALPIGDEADYHALAGNLAAGEGYRLENGQLTARRPPLYPAVLSVVYRVFGPDIGVARFLQVAIGTLAVWLTFLVAKRFVSHTAAVLALWVVGVNPYLVFVSAYLLSENLYVVMLLAALLLVPGPVSRRLSAKRVAGAGLVLGLASLARPTGFPFALWVAFFLFVYAGGVRARFARASVFLAALLVALVPWAARNHVVFGKWIPFTTHGGLTFYQGNNPVVLEYPQYYGGVTPLNMLPGNDSLRTKGEIEGGEAAWALGRRFLLENKREIPRLVLRKFGRFWRFRSEAGMSGIRSGWWWKQDSPLGRLAARLDVGFIYAVFIVPLFVAGLLLSFRRRHLLNFLYGIICVHTFLALVFHGSLRSRIPVEPVMAILSAYAIYIFAARWRGVRASLFDDESSERAGGRSEASSGGA